MDALLAPFAVRVDGGGRRAPAPKPLVVPKLKDGAQGAGHGKRIGGSDVGDGTHAWRGKIAPRVRRGGGPPEPAARAKRIRRTRESSFPVQPRRRTPDRSAVPGRYRATGCGTQGRSRLGDP